MSKFKGSTRLATADIDLFESDGYLSDATITCGDRTWNVHKLILGSRCEWFRAAFYGNMKVSFALIAVASHRSLGFGS